MGNKMVSERSRSWGKELSRGAELELTSVDLFAKIPVEVLYETDA
jgi:hypothetical protein